MMLDKELLLTYTASGSLETQAFTDAAATPSYNQLDLGANQTYADGVAGATPVATLGNGQPMYLITRVAVNAGAGTGSALGIRLVAATDSAFTSSRIIANTGLIASALIPVGTLIVLPVPPSLSYRYWRMEVILNNNDNDYTIKSFLSPLAPTPLKHLGPAYLA